jgi:type I restriction enzyme S subunit
MPEDDKRTLTPKLRFPEFRKAEGWEPHILKQLSSEILDGDWIESKDQSDGGFRLVQTGNVGVGEFIAKSGKSRYVSEDTFARLRCTEVFPGDCLVSRLPDPAGRSCLLPDIGERMITAVDCTIIRFNEQKIVRDLFIAHSQTDNYFREVAALSSGSTRQRISRENLSNLSIYLPAIAEQQKIADCLTSLDECVAAQGRKVEALKAHKKGLMQQLFPREGETLPRLRFPEFRDDADTATLGEVVEIASGQVDPTAPPYCDLPHIGSENIESDMGNLRGVTTAKELRIISGNYLFDERDVLYSKIRPALNKVASPGFKGTCSADIYPLRPSNGQLCREYLAYLLQSQAFLEYAVKQSSRSKIPKINRDGLSAYEVQLVAVAEQQQIAACLSSLDARIAAETEKLAALKAHKKGLMQQLFPSVEGD